MPPNTKIRIDLTNEDSDCDDASVEKESPEHTETDPYYMGLDAALQRMMPNAMEYDDGGRILPLNEQVIKPGAEYFLKGPTAVELAFAMDNYDYDSDKLPPAMKLKLENAETIFPQYFAALRKTVLAMQLDPDAERGGVRIYKEPYEYTVPVKDGESVPRRNSMIVSRTNFARHPAGGTKRKLSHAAETEHVAKLTKTTPECENPR